MKLLHVPYPTVAFVLTGLPARLKNESFSAWPRSERVPSQVRLRPATFVLIAKPPDSQAVAISASYVLDARQASRPSVLM